MTNHDKPQFAALMAALGEYYNRDISPALIGMYWNGLQHFDLAAVREAMNLHMQNPDSGQFMPKIADITKMLGGSTQDAALRAWAKVDQAVRKVGVYADVAFDDPLIHRVLHDMGGWIALGNVTEDELPFKAKEFENRYRGFRVRGAQPEYPPVLIGIAGAYNRRGNHECQAPILIGDSHKAQAVMRAGTERPLVGFAPAGNTASSLRLVEASE